MTSAFALSRVVDALRGGAVIAYPTEGVYGVGCLPSHPNAVARVLALKGRDPAKGLILLVGCVAELDGWATIDATARLASADEPYPVTWIVPAGPRAYPALTGGRDTIAVRVTAHPVAARLSRLAGEPLVSTSANLSGRRPVRNRLLLRRQFGERVDLIVPGALGSADGPSEIRDLATGRVLRPYCRR